MKITGVIMRLPQTLDFVGKMIQKIPKSALPFFNKFIVHATTGGESNSPQNPNITCKKTNRRMVVSAGRKTRKNK